MSKIPVVVLGATGIVGQRFIEMLANHPWFEIAALVGSDRSAGRAYGEAANWVLAGDPPAGINEMQVLPLNTNIPGRVVFSALPAAVAKEVELDFAAAGFVVCSNASAYRLETDIPVIIPEVNGDHLQMLEIQKRRGWKGLIITSPNCTTTGIVMAVDPLHKAFKVNRLMATSFQAVSGAGFPGVPFLSIYDNVIPFVPGEEEKMEKETRVLLGKMVNGQRQEAEIVVSAQANRVPVVHGHTVCISVGFEKRPSIDEALNALEEYRGLESVRNLPSAPSRPVVVRYETDRPQPRQDRDLDLGMTCTVGRVRPCPILDLRLVSVTHNAIRGAAGGCLLNAELLKAEGYIS
jgi:aspartate-semialdehyde dehydrogenase